MSYQVLARKYRPQKFSDVIGQEHVTRTLKNAIEQERIAHGYIFSGHRGIGKTTVARILAMSLNCRKSKKPTPDPCGECDSSTEIRNGNSVDVIEIDAATNRGIDEIRELREAARYRPARDRFKIYILDEAHQITDAAFNALLKTLEEPPGHVIFMLATTQPEDIPQTIRSRCQHFSFRAVKFDDIVAQLRQIVDREMLVAQSGVFKTVDLDAYPLIAEAADGSMRDALSILDQAIASSSGELTADVVRNLIGAAPAAVLENVMQAVAQSSSETVLRLVDELLNEGHSPAHFARQMVRFLRNITVAKIAGADSALLQISSDERARAARVAELFSEEDLARHLQIMLRTNGELGYRKEQRFHLELGLLKMAHAQRLLPIEQLLSDVAAPPSSSRPSATSRVAATEVRRAEPAPSARPNFVSPFEADSARKNKPKAQVSEAPPDGTDTPFEATQDRPARAPAQVVVMGAVAPAVAELAPEPAPSLALSKEVAALRDCVLSSLREQAILISMLEAAEWSLDGNSLIAKVAASGAMIDMSFNADARRVASAAASSLVGKPVKVLVQSSGAAQNASAPRPASSNGSARSRAEQDPIVRRMQEKFGAEIRTVIDYREKGN